MEKYKKVFDFLKGVIKTADFVAAGYNRAILVKLLKDDYISKITRGYYEWNYDKPISDAVIINKLFPDAVVFLNSALYIYKYVDRTPNEWHLAVKKNIRRTRFDIIYPQIQPYYISEKYMSIGKTQVVFEGHKLNIFDKDRTICDVLRYSNKLDKELVNQAIQSYVNDSEKNIANLMKYARDMRTENKVKTIIGMWL